MLAGSAEALPYGRRRNHIMAQTFSARTEQIDALGAPADSRVSSSSILTKYAGWIGTHNIPFLVSSIGMIVMLLWAGSYKMTAPGAEGIIPLVTNSPLISWHFKVFGPYLGSDLIGLTEWTAAMFLLLGYKWPKAGILGGSVATGMFFTTSTMLLTTPDALTAVHGMKYMSFLGLFLYKDIISLGVSLYLIAHFGRRAAQIEIMRAAGEKQEASLLSESDR
jgi:uncharacterized membrane protein YkgB